MTSPFAKGVAIDGYTYLILAGVRRGTDAIIRSCFILIQDEYDEYDE